MTIQKNITLNKFTSFDVGGPAEELVICTDSNELADYLSSHSNNRRLNVLGYGSNVLISDTGLPGTTIVTRSHNIKRQGSTLVADAGVWWDDLVSFSVKNNMPGMECLSGVPGGVGGAVFINITAYGQSASDTLSWIDVFDIQNQKVIRLDATKLKWGYKQSHFQTPAGQNHVILRAGFEMDASIKQLEYQSALDVAQELGLNPGDIKDRREIILEARRRAGSIYIPGRGYEKTVGSFFRNPLVTSQQAVRVIEFDETSKTKQQILLMNKVHGGNQQRVSAAHVLLAAGFKRGQQWGNVRLHNKNLLKIENIGDATAQQIYDVAQEITETVNIKLGINLEPEAQILGKFKN